MAESRVDIKLADYLRTPQCSPQSFHCRVGKHSSVRIGLGEGEDDRPTAPRLFGFPVPGPQCPTPSSVIARDYFVHQSTWEAILDHGHFDFIVIGSGFAALAFITEAYKINPWAKILCLERGGFWLPVHFQNLPIPTDLVLGGSFETFPWTLSVKTFQEPGIPGLKASYLHGMCPFFGGRSTIWSSWCPRPPMDLLDDFPESMRAAAAREDFWTAAGELLNVTTASDIDNQTFDVLQDSIDRRMKAVAGITGMTYSESARLAVAPRSPTSTLRFTKYSVPGPLLTIFEKQKLRSKNEARDGYPLQMAINCIVQRLGQVTGGYVRSVETSRGTLSFTGDNTKIILCGSTIPNATLVLNSFKHLRSTAGRRLTGHFVTHLTARCPKAAFGDLNKLEMGAHYLAGQHPETGQEYHIQITATHSPNPEHDQEDLVREAPDFAAAPTKEQLHGSENKVVFVFATVGEMEVNETGDDEADIDGWDGGDSAPAGRKGSFMKLNNGIDPTCNIDLQYQFTENDKSTWDVMDKATFETILALAGPKYKNQVEYWNEAPGHQGWMRQKPDVSTIRIPGIVHEGSTLFMGPREAGGCVDDDFRVHGTNNIYVTGAALFPAPGSWNPTLAICGFAQELARKIVPPAVQLYTRDQNQKEPEGVRGGQCWVN